MRVRETEGALSPVRSTPPNGMLAEWIGHRGEVLFEATVDLVGSFPGFAERGGVVAGVQLRLTDAFLLVEEGQPYGFGVPLSSVTGFEAVASPLREELDLRIFYRVDGSARFFTIRFRPNRLALRAGRRADRAREVLMACGVAPTTSSISLPEPDFTIDWDHAAGFEDENVIWSGCVSAPIKIGETRVPCNAWLSTRSLMWGSPAGRGINRIPIPLLLESLSTRLGDRAGTPAVYVTIGDEATGRYDMPFVFDQETPVDRNFRERGAFVVGLRSRGIPDGLPVLLGQPWRLDIIQLPVDPIEDAVAEASSGAPSSDGPEDVPAPAPKPVVRRGGIAARVQRNQMPLVVAAIVADSQLGSSVPESETPILPATLAESGATQVDSEGSLPAEQPLPLASSDGPADVVPNQSDDGLVDQGHVEAKAGSVETAAFPVEQSAHDVAANPPLWIESTESDTVSATLPPSDPWQPIQRYEAAAVSSIAETTRAIDRLRDHETPVSLHDSPPTWAEQSAAMAALLELMVSAALRPEAALRRKQRLTGLGDAAVRLRTLLELHRGGHLTLPELNERRTKILGDLAEILASGQR